MFESLSRGWQMTKASFKVLSLDKEILVLPLMAGVLMIAAVVGVGYGAFGLGIATGTELGGLLTLFAIYVVMYAVVIFFNAAVIEMATIRFNGGDPVVKDGLKKAWSKLHRIIQWALVAATVGLILHILRNMARDRNSFLGQILVGLVETAWNIATFFVIPLAIYQDLGPFDAIKSSTSRMKRTWGESITGIATTGIIFFVLGLVGLLPMWIAYSLYASGAIMAAYALGAVVVVYWVALAAVNSAVDGILVAALYKYSTEGQMPQLYTQQGVDAQALAW